MTLLLGVDGRSGAGKTSLMRLVAGRLAPEAGSVRVGGADPPRTGAARGGNLEADRRRHPRRAARPCAKELPCR